MKLIGLSEIDASMIDLVGGKGAGLGEMIRAGERVPDGFCLTVECYRSGELPERELVEAYERLGGGRVAVRSSAIAEDLPEASFAGQQDTYLGVEGHAELIDAVRRCWDSLFTERAVAYRAAVHVEDEPAMAMVVQRMIDPVVAGVMFTANPITGCRTDMVVDAAPGLGTAIAEGTVVPDHHVLRRGAPAVPDPDGCLDAARLEELRAAGARLQEHFGSPQDVEWAIDAGGTLWLLQSRPITTLFPPPPDTGDTRLYLEFGHMQGMLRPCTPMGFSLLKSGSSLWFEAAGARVDRRDPMPRLVSIGGRAVLRRDRLPAQRGHARAPGDLAGDLRAEGAGRRAEHAGRSAVRAAARSAVPRRQPGQGRAADVARRGRRSRVEPGQPGSRPRPRLPWRRGDQAPHHPAGRVRHRRGTAAVGDRGLPQADHEHRHARDPLAADGRHDRRDDPGRAAQGLRLGRGARHRARRHAVQRDHGDGPRALGPRGAGP
ncbi:PEP/pyruvate-binding domain-containing protein [Nonomuraea ferruginea]